MEYIAIILRMIFFYIFIIFIYRIMGKREVGQLGIVDLIVSILIAELVAICIENPKESIMSSIIPIIIGVAIKAIIANTTITANNSIKVKPFLFIFIYSHHLTLFTFL